MGFPVIAMLHRHQFLPTHILNRFKHAIIEAVHNSLSHSKPWGFKNQVLLLSENARYQPTTSIPRTASRYALAWRNGTRITTAARDSESPLRVWKWQKPAFPLNGKAWLGSGRSGPPPTFNVEKWQSPLPLWESLTFKCYDL